MNLPEGTDPRRVAAYLGRGRVGIGLALILAPGVVGRSWIGPAGATPGARVFVRLTGIRDAVVGLGTTIAAGQRRGGADWLSMGAVCDAGDALVSLVTPGLPKRARLLGVVVVAAAVGQFLVAQDLAADERGASEMEL